MIGRNDPRKSLIASAKRVKLGNRTKKIGEDWQQPLWDIYENLGAVHYGMNFKRSAAQRVSYYVAELPDEDVDEPIPSENQAANEALDRLGDMGQIVGEFVVQENVAGEGYLLGQEAEEETWEVLSTIEVNKRRQYGADIDNPIGEDDFLLRLWKSSPRLHWMADSPLRSVQAQCEQLLLLNEQIGATAMSRIPAGLLAVASEFSFASNVEEGPDTGANAGNDPFTSELIEYLTAAIQDSGSAARIAPGVLRGPFEMIDKGIKLIDFGRDMDKTFAEMREELLRQIANGIDLPAEILTGLADLNHWSMWGIDESTAKHHVDPDILQILSGLTTGYLREVLTMPTGEGGGGMTKDQASRFLIWRDYSDLTARPLSIDHGIALVELGVISDEFMRRVANVPEDGAGDGSVRKVSAESPAGPENVTPGPPMTAANSVSLSRFADIDQTLATQIIEASEAAFMRAMERAGAKVRTQVKKDRDVTAMIDRIPNEDVVMTLGAARLERFQLTPDQLLPADTFKQLEDRINRLLITAQAQVEEELEPYVDPVFIEADADRNTGIRAFIAALFAVATARLFNVAPDPDPADTGEISDTITTGQMVFQLLTTAGGGGVVEEFTETTPRGFALGERTRAAFRDAGYVTESQTWRYGIAPRRTFEPHLSLSGTEITNLEAPALMVSSRYAWLGVSHYFPGDHKGCLCQLVPTVLPTDGVG